MSYASDFLKKWVHKNIKGTTAAMRNDRVTAEHLANECLYEAQGEHVSQAKLIDAAGGDLVTFMVSELNRAADRGIYDE